MFDTGIPIWNSNCCYDCVPINTSIKVSLLLCVYYQKRKSCQLSPGLWSTSIYCHFLISSSNAQDSSLYLFCTVDVYIHFYFYLSVCFVIENCWLQHHFYCFCQQTWRFGIVQSLKLVLIFFSFFYFFFLLRVDGVRR